MFYEWFSQYDEASISECREKIWQLHVFMQRNKIDNHQVEKRFFNSVLFMMQNIDAVKNNPDVDTLKANTVIMNEYIDHLQNKIYHWWQEQDFHKAILETLQRAK